MRRGEDLMVGTNEVHRCHRVLHPFRAVFQIGRFPELSRWQAFNVMSNIVTSTCQAGHLVALDRVHNTWCADMNRLLLEAARSIMTMQAFAIAEGAV